MMRVQVIALGLLGATLTLADNYDLSWYTFDGGGAMFSTGGGFELGGTAGQPDAGPVLTGGGFSLTGGFWAVAGMLKGDLNCDGSVNFGDINPFVLALTGRAPYESAFPNCYWLNADVNGDGQVNFADINPFVALLTGGG